MSEADRILAEAQFVRMARAKVRKPAPAQRLGESLVAFYKQTVQQTRRFSGLAQVWETLIPPEINEHCCLHAFRTGTLTVLVDSSAHMYRLKQLLLSGVQKQLVELCRAQGLRKIALKPGRWYEGDQDRRLSWLQ